MSLLRKNLSIYLDTDSNEIKLGLLPPISKTINNPPYFLEDLFNILCSNETDLNCIFQSLKSIHQDIETIDFVNVMSDLDKLRVFGDTIPMSRYNRHEMFYDLLDLSPIEAQSKLSKSTVGVLGFGGIGTNVAMHLATAGVGNIIISDGDTLELSNLTRTHLFEETDVGEKKVIKGKQRLIDRNSNIEIKSVCSQYDSADFIEKHFKDVDFLILSADSPNEIHEWTRKSCLKLGIPYLQAGYTEIYGSVGPLIIPGKTACYQCMLLQDEISIHTKKQLNKNIQSSSYGPLNSLVASIASNECIRYILSLDNSLEGVRLFINSTNYKMTRHSYLPQRSCGCVESPDKFDEIANLYIKERNTESLNALFLDDLILEKLSKQKIESILDLGCGIGTIGIKASKTCDRIVGVDLSNRMIEKFQLEIESRNLTSKCTAICADITKYSDSDQYDAIIFNLVLDYILHPEEILKKFAKNLNLGGFIYIVIPHPFKDSGKIIKNGNEVNFELVDYFHEGVQEKIRLDNSGKIVVEGVKSYKRTLESYFNIIKSAGLRIEEFIEPHDFENTKKHINVKLANKIPYFLILICSK